MSDHTEQWRPVSGYEGLYEVSDLGGIRSVDRVVPIGSGDRTRRYTGRTLKPSADSDGRRRVILYRPGPTCRSISAMVLEAFVGPRPEGHECCHHDGDASNDRLENLRWDTRSANHLDAVRHGTHGRTRRRACPRGHFLVQPNLVLGALRAGRRSCQACHLTRGRQRYARQHGRPFDFMAEAQTIYEDIMGSA